jgi:hypothetical protein
MMRAMRFGCVLVVAALACGKSEAPAPAPASGSAPVQAQGSGSAPVAAATAPMTDAQLEKMLRETVDMFEALAGVTGLTCAEKAKQMNLELDKRKALLAELGRPKPANEPDISDRFYEVAERTGLKDRLQISVMTFENAIVSCDEDAEIKKIIERVQQR